MPTTIEHNSLDWWHKRTTLEKYLLAASALASILLIALFIGLILLATKDEHANENSIANICFSDECIHSSSLLLQNMKTEIDPCTDFYEFACGSFLDKINIPADESYVDTFSKLFDKVREQLKDIILEQHLESEAKHIRLPNMLYRACMNTTFSEEQSYAQVLAITDLVGGWPVLKGAQWDKDNNWSWQDATHKLAEIGMNYDMIMSFHTAKDRANSRRFVLELTQSNLYLDREFLIQGLNETFVEAYYDFMVDTAVLFGANKAQAQTELAESLQFEIELAKISWPAEKFRDVWGQYNMMNISQMQQTYPYVHWLSYINKLLPAGMSVTEIEPLNLQVPSFYKSLGPLMAKTPKRVIANYMVWHMHAYLILFQSAKFRRRLFEYDMVLLGVKEQEDRSKECLEDVTDSLPIAVGSLYVKKHFKAESKQAVAAIVQDIRLAYKEILQQVDWMDDVTKQIALKKLQDIRVLIGYPDELVNEELLLKHYKQLKLNFHENDLEANLKIEQFNNEFHFARLHKPIDALDWTDLISPAVVNAIYDALQNLIELTAAILQGQFFHIDRPKYMNYGAIGQIIGHELTHGFDDTGRHYNAEGNLVNWWGARTKQAFLNKTKCMIEQYGNITDNITGLKLNALNSLGENIADNGGLKESHRAYMNWLQKNAAAEPQLPGLNFTNKQMFWISAAQPWCEKYRKEALKDFIMNDEHLPANYRVLVPFSNSIDFAKDFNCPLGSPMNPEHKCSVW